MCAFCDVVADPTTAHIVYEDEASLAFLDHRPLFHGHTLVIPRAHFETLGDLPLELVEPYFGAVRRLSVAVERAMEALGTFVALNNKVSQSVPHLHVHVVPRRPKDGLKGFFWPRTRYESEQEAAAIAATIAKTVAGAG